jgi:membrane associated rhomboid family serine protease
VVSEPDLFVVCKNCSSEVSPYVTECPYCGQRVRKRAPKIERGDSSEPKPPRRARQRTSLPRLKRGEIPGIATDRRPYGTLALIAVAIAVMAVWAADRLTVVDHLVVAGPIDGEYWKLITTSFVYLDHFGYAFIALTAIGVFGTMLERRFGLVFVVTTFLLAAAGGTAFALALDPLTVVIGGNGAALGLLCAWLVDDWLARRRGDDRENDLLGVYVFAVVLLLIPLAEPDAHVLAAVGGAAVGTAMGAIASPFRP